MNTVSKEKYISGLDEKFLMVLDLIQIPIAVLIPERNQSDEIEDFIYIYVNEYAALSNRMSREELSGRKLLDIFPDHGTNGVFDSMKHAFITGNKVEVKLDDFEGGPENKVRGNFRLNLVRYNDYVIANWLDNTFIQSQAMDIENLKASNEELEQFAYIASHDLQEPLRMITSFTQLLQKRYADKLDSDANEFINFAVDGARRMKNLIDDLLIYSRVVTKAKEWRRIDTNHIIENIINDFRFLIDETKTKIIYKDLPVVHSDKAMLSRLFTNLISNAIKYRREEDPVVEITAVRENHEWIFSVKDNGIGIEEKYFEKIFLIFQRLHGRNRYQGTGIGLAVCKKIIDKLGGRIWLASEPGKGSSFFFSIPERQNNV